MRIIPIGFIAASITACGAILGSEDDVTNPVRTTPDSGTLGADATSDVDVGDVQLVDAEADASSAADASDASDAGAPKVVFVSSSTYSGGFGTRQDADALCASLATTANATRFGSSTWKAYLAAGNGASAAARITDRAYVRVDGMPVFNKGPQTEKTPLTLLAMDENGTSLATSLMKFVWTGHAGDAGANTRTCADWTSNAGNTFGGYGDMHTTAQWAEQIGVTAGCDSTFRIYCFED